MDVNMGKTDRLLRVFVVVPVLVVVGVLVGPTSLLASILYFVAAVMLATSAVGYCPLYTAIHRDTLGRQRPVAH